MYVFNETYALSHFTLLEQQHKNRNAIETTLLLERDVAKRLCQLISSERKQASESISS